MLLSVRLGPPGRPLLVPEAVLVGRVRRPLPLHRPEPLPQHRHGQLRLLLAAGKFQVPRGSRVCGVCLSCRRAVWLGTACGCHRSWRGPSAPGQRDMTARADCSAAAAAAAGRPAVARCTSTGSHGNVTRRLAPSGRPAGQVNAPGAWRMRTRRELHQSIKAEPSRLLLTGWKLKQLTCLWVWGRRSPC